MLLNDLHHHLARWSVGTSPSDRGVLSLMILLHTHTLIISKEVAVDDVTLPTSGDELELPAVTRSHAAEIVASLWPVSNKRGTHDFWHLKFITESPCESIDEIPAELLKGFHHIKIQLEASPLISKLIES